MTDNEEEREGLLVTEEEQDGTSVLQDVREHMAELKNRQKTEGRTDEDPDKPDMPEEIGAAVLKYHKSAEVAGTLIDTFETNVAFYGSHVVNSNTKRLDNLRHLGELDSARMARSIPYIRKCGTDIKVRSTSEFQMCRSNPEIGGFDQKMGRTNITKEDVDLKQQQTINKTGKEKGGGILGFLSFGKKKAV
jgi:hypothetical protein